MPNGAAHWRPNRFTAQLRFEVSTKTRVCSEKSAKAARFAFNEALSSEPPSMNSKTRRGNLLWAAASKSVKFKKRCALNMAAQVANAQPTGTGTIISSARCP